MSISVERIRVLDDVTRSEHAFYAPGFLLCADPDPLVLNYFAQLPSFIALSHRRHPNIGLRLAATLPSVNLQR